MVFFDVSGLATTASEFNQQPIERGVRVSVLGPTRLRAVTHLDIDEQALN